MDIVERELKVLLYTRVRYKCYIRNLWTQHWWKEVSCRHLWVEIVITRKCSVSEVFKSWSPAPWRLLITPEGRNLDSLALLRKLLFHLGLSWSTQATDGTWATDSELCSLRDEGIQEGSELGVESGHRHGRADVRPRYGHIPAIHYAFTSTSSHTLPGPSGQPNLQFPINHIGVVLWGSQSLPHYFWDLLRIS